MNANKLLLTVVPAALMIGAMIALRGHEQWFASLGKTPQAALLLGRIGIALPYLGAAAIGIITLFACAGALAVRSAGWGVLAGASAVVGFAAWSEGSRLLGLAGRVRDGSVLAYADPATLTGSLAVIACALFALRVALAGNAAFAAAAPRRV
ncbi:MAG: conjugal transfer protein TraG, partial [Rhizobiales bacterium]|nr:conjugal transfer protein TraG [Hyphomicrobiales bacterium]